MPTLYVNTLVRHACRSGVTDVIFPLGNQKEYEDVPEDLKQGITPHFVDNYEQVNIIVSGINFGGLGSSRCHYVRTQQVFNSREGVSNGLSRALCRSRQGRHKSELLLLASC
jgi:hypothetical protein